MATWQSLYRFIYYKVQNREEAEDITQETYLKALSYMQKKNNKIEKHISFFKTVALNIIRDKGRKTKRRGTSINIDGINPGEIALEDPTESIIEKETIQEALMLLGKEQRMVINLRIIKGYSVSDTAKRMDKSENNIRVIQYRAIENLTKILKWGE